MVAWLMYLAAKAKRVGQGYDDNPSTHYSWDSRVNNASHVSVGDVIVLWEGNTLLGLSVIEDITTGAGTKKLSWCPKCGKADINERVTKTPKYLCWNAECRAEFDTPDSKIVPVTTYCAWYEAGWIDLRGHLSKSELQALCEAPKSQNALRRLRWDSFRARVETGRNATPLAIADTASKVIAGGHKTRTVRVRNGQAVFRASLLEQFGEVCAFLGPMPAATLEAAHLYSYARDGKHRSHGGLLLRRDVHRLFDLGLIAIEPSTTTLDIAASARVFPAYGRLHGKSLAVPLTSGHQRWIVEHWAMHRGAVSAVP